MCQSFDLSLLPALHIVTLRHVSVIWQWCVKLFMMINFCRDFREQNYCNLQDSFELPGKFTRSEEVLLRYFAWWKKDVSFTVHSHPQMNISFTRTMEDKNFCTYFNQCNLFVKKGCWFIVVEYLTFLFCTNIVEFQLTLITLWLLPLFHFPWHLPPSFSLVESKHINKQKLYLLDMEHRILCHRALTYPIHVLQEPFTSWMFFS